MKKFITIILIIIAIFAILAGVRFFANQEAHKSSDKPATAYITSTAVKVKQMPNQVSTIGSLAAWQHIEVSPEVAGIIQHIYFTGGEQVKKGQKLAQLDNAVYQAAVNSAQADYNAVKAKFQRYSTLKKTRTVAQQDYDDVLANYQTKTANLNSAKVRMSKMQLVAPFNGVISERLKDVGQYVSSGTAIARLVNKSKLKLYFSLPEKYLHQVKLGQTTQFTTNAVPSKVFSGKLIYIAPSVKATTRTLPLIAEIDNPKNLLSPGLFGNVTQILGMFKHAIVIPDNAIVPTISGPMVYAIRDNKAYLTSVTIGIRYKGQVQILSGLNKNSVVATSGIAKLKDGVLVNTKAAKTS